ncbi:MAG TPA: hypothetical protein P5299_02305 [Candidatus Woesebacteria bacterium]|nr:hypothetical protein [Candidatus Woesebacteria bacterium]
MKLIENGWELGIDLMGGRITELRKDNQQILGTFQRIDGKKGSTHVCFPCFGNEMPKLPFHGPARDEKWTIADTYGENAEIVYSYKKWRIKQIFKLEKVFVHQFIIENKGMRKLPVNLAVHYYFNLNYKDLTINGDKMEQYIKADGEIQAKRTNIIDDGTIRILMILDGFERIHLWTGRKNGIYDESYCCLEPLWGLRQIQPREKANLTVKLRV